jgi:hypothetical protein
MTLAAEGGNPLVPAIRLLRIVSWATLVLCLILLAPAYAQTDEIQVYTGEINKPGEFSITLHGNYTPNATHLDNRHTVSITEQIEGFQQYCPEAYLIDGSSRCT